MQRRAVQRTRRRRWGGRGMRHGQMAEANARGCVRQGYVCKGTYAGAGGGGGGGAAAAAAQRMGGVGSLYTVVAGKRYTQGSGACMRGGHGGCQLAGSCSTGEGAGSGVPTRYWGVGAARGCGEMNRTVGFCSNLGGLGWAEAARAEVRPAGCRSGARGCSCSTAKHPTRGISGRRNGTPQQSVGGGHKLPQRRVSGRPQNPKTPKPLYIANLLK